MLLQDDEVVSQNTKYHACPVDAKYLFRGYFTPNLPELSSGNNQLRMSICELEIMKSKKKGRKEYKMKNYKILLNHVMSSLFQLRIINKNEIELIKFFLLKNTESYFNKKEIIQKIDLNYIKCDINFEEYIELRKKEKSFNNAIIPQFDKKSINTLVSDGILEDKKDGIVAPEPYFNAPYNLLSYRKPKQNISRVLLNQSNFKNWLYKNVLGILTPLETRKQLASEIGYNLSYEPAIIFSNSPAIFNPYEFEEQYPNHTKFLVKMIKESDKPIFYNWNLESIKNQIKKHLNCYTISERKIKKKYYNHFSNFVHNKNLFITCGDNNRFKKNWDTTPFISKNTFIKAERIDGKIHHGIVINTENASKIPKIFGSIGELLSIQSKHKMNNFNQIRRKILDDSESIKLEGLNNKSILKFIDRIFEEALK